MMDLFFTNIAYADSVDVFVGKLGKVIVNPLIELLFALAVVYFLYGLLEFIGNQENQEKKTTGKSHMIYGIIGMTIMMGVFAIMNIMIRTLNIKGIDPQKGTVNLPNP